MIIVKIKTGNAAFEGDSLYPELKRIFNNLAQNIGSGFVPGVIRDINGNTVGEVDFK